MTIWKRAGSALCGAVAVAAVVGLSAAPAMAVPASTSLKAKVTGGGSITATAGTTELTAGPITVTCTSSKAKGTISNGTKSGSAPLTVGTTKTLSFSKCSGPAGSVSNSPKKLPYDIKVDSKTTTKGDTDGVIGPVSVNVSTAGCSFTVTGYAPGYYSNSKHELIIGGKLPTKASTKAQLTIEDVATSCAGFVTAGEHPTFKTTYKVSKKVKIAVS